MNSDFEMGLGGAEEGSPREQGFLAAREAKGQVGELAPSFAVLVGRDRAHAEEIQQGAREALGGCPLLGCVSDVSPLGGSASRLKGVRILLFASPHITAKVGVGAAAGATWEQEVTDALRNSYIHPPVGQIPEDSPERGLYYWYRYRRPSIAFAIVISRPGEEAFRVRKVSTFLRKWFHARAPFLMFSHAPEGEEPAVFADGRLVSGGIVLAMVKTDLRFSLERFHHFEPLGAKLFITKAEGNRILELNGKPAVEAYLASLGHSGQEAPDSRGVPGLFPLFPLAYRSRDGRYHLIVPRVAGDDGSIEFPAKPDQDHTLYLMGAVSSAELMRVAGGTGERPARDPGSLAGRIVLRNPSLRDLSTMVLEHPGKEAESGRLVEVALDESVTAHIAPGDWEGEAGHLQLVIGRQLDPISGVALENERLLREVVHMKDINQKIFDGIGYGIALVGPGHQIQHCNDTYRSLVGAPAAFVNGAPCPWADPAQPRCSPCAAQEALEHHTFFSHEVLRQGEKGKSWLRVDAFPLRDESGKAAFAVEVIRDITAFKQLVQNLESEQQKMEAVVRGMAETLYIVSPDYNLHFLHPGSFPLEGDGASAPAGRKCFERLFRRDFPCPWCRMTETLNSGQVDRRIAQFRPESGEERAYQATFSPWRDREGNTIAVVCLLVDISSQRRMERQIIQSEKLNSLSILSAGMAHELNNPLGAINFNLEILKRRERDQEYQDVLGSIKKDVQRISRIVGNLLSFSKGSVSSFAWLRITDIIDASLDLIQTVMARNKVQVQREYQADLPLIWGNSQDLQQVFINLISNSIDAMPAGGTIGIKVGSSLPDPREACTARIAVVYDHAGDIASLRTLLDVPQWDVGFFRGEDEAIDFFRHRHNTLPDVVILDYAAVDHDRTAFFVTMVREIAPKAHVLAIVDGAGASGKTTPGALAADSIVQRPLDAERLLDAVRSRLPERPGDTPLKPVVKVTFSDTGSGIPPAILERIFDPFFTTKPENKGTGLGLSVVHKILENHAATVKVKSTVGQGTTFTLKFPQSQSVVGEAPSPFRGSGGVKGVRR